MLHRHTPLAAIRLLVGIVRGYFTVFRFLLSACNSMKEKRKRIACPRSQDVAWVGVGVGVGVPALCRLPPIRSLASSYIVFTCFAQTFAYPIACSKQKASGLQLWFWHWRWLRLRLRLRL